MSPLVLAFKVNCELILLPHWVWIMCGFLISFCFIFPFAPAHKPEEMGALGQCRSHTDPGSEGPHSWHPGGTVRCPVGSGQGAAVRVHSPVRPRHSDFYIHTYACPMGRGQETEKIPHDPKHRGHTSGTGTAQQGFVPGPMQAG